MDLLRAKEQFDEAGQHEILPLNFDAEPGDPIERALSARHLLIPRSRGVKIASGFHVREPLFEAFRWCEPVNLYQRLRTLDPIDFDFAYHLSAGHDDKQVLRQNEKQLKELAMSIRATEGMPRELILAQHGDEIESQLRHVDADYQAEQKKMVALISETSRADGETRLNRIRQWNELKDTQKEARAAQKAALCDSKRQEIVDQLREQHRLVSARLLTVKQFDRFFDVACIAARKDCIRTPFDQLAELLRRRATMSWKELANLIIKSNQDWLKAPCSAFVMMHHKYAQEVHGYILGDEEEDAGEFSAESGRGIILNNLKARNKKIRNQGIY